MQVTAFRILKLNLLTAWLVVLAGLVLPVSAANPDGDLSVDIITAWNLVVDSNVESPSTYAPRSAYLAAKFKNNGTNDLTDVFMYIGNYVDGTNDTPGIYPSRPHLPLLGPLPGSEFALTHEGGSAGTDDAIRPLTVSLAPGEEITSYWLISYPNLDTNGAAVWGPSIKPEDDLWLEYDIWATANDDGTPLTAVQTRKVTMRNEISAMANKIYPNTAGKVPIEYREALDQYVPSWTNVVLSGQPGASIFCEGIWYDLGTVVHGFDNNDIDSVPDQNAWLQPVGDPSRLDPASFRLKSTHAMVVVKLKTGGEQIYIVDDQLYFENLPDNNGSFGLVLYEYMALKPGGTGTLTPYQEVASGFDNEKFNGDYGLTPPGMTIPESSIEMEKTVDLAVAWPGDNLNYEVTYTNSGEEALGDPSVGMPLVVQDEIPTAHILCCSQCDQQ